MKAQAQGAGLTYKDAGVDIDGGAALVERIREPVKRTRRPEVLGSLGGFGALTRIPARYRDPVLVSGTDGVGTKLRLAIDLGRYDEVGQDLVAMCVNDLLVMGAEPLLFLDYYATGRLEVERAAQVITGIARGCELAGCALVGGETAEMPGMYAAGDYDLAGFSVGVVESDAILDGKAVKVGDRLLALASSGPHSNGFSLIRHILKLRQIDVASATLPSGAPLADALLSPTRIYVRAVLKLLATVKVHALAHLTGGGFWENIPRVLPAGLGAAINEGSWQWPEIFTWLQEQGGVERHEMYRTFNCGVGMVVALEARDVETACRILTDQGERVWELGEVVSIPPGAPQVTIG